MKRDMDLIREILLAVSENPSCDGIRFNFFNTAEELGIHNYSTEEVAYHVSLLISAGYLDGKVMESFAVPCVKGLTWNGHEFIDNIKNQEIWERTKRRIASLSSVALSVVAQIAQSEIKLKLGLP
jgi:hypothetical protein